MFHNQLSLDISEIVRRAYDFIKNFLGGGRVINISKLKNLYLYHPFEPYVISKPPERERERDFGTGNLTF